MSATFASFDFDFDSDELPWIEATEGNLGRYSGIPLILKHGQFLYIGRFNHLKHKSTGTRFYFTCDGMSMPRMATQFIPLTILMHSSFTKQDMDEVVEDFKFSKQPDIIKEMRRDAERIKLGQEAEWSPVPSTMPQVAPGEYRTIDGVEYIHDLKDWEGDPLPHKIYRHKNNMVIEIETPCTTAITLALGKAYISKYPKLQWRVLEPGQDKNAKHGIFTEVDEDGEEYEVFYNNGERQDWFDPHAFAGNGGSDND